MINEAIAKLYTNDIFNCICMQHGGEHGEDIKGDIIMMILSIPEPKLKHIVSEGYLLPYALQMVRYQCSSNKSTKLNKKYFDEKMIPASRLSGMAEFEVTQEYPEANIVLGDFIEARVLNDSIK